MSIEHWYPPASRPTRGSWDSYYRLCRVKPVSSGTSLSAPAAGSSGLLMSEQQFSSAFLTAAASSAMLTSRRPAADPPRLLSSEVLCPTSAEFRLSSGILYPGTSSVPGGHRPLSIAHVGPCLCRGGAEQQLIDLARFLNPQRAVLKTCYVTAGGQYDPAVVRDLPCPVRPGTRESLRRAYQEHDVVLSWGLALDEVLGGPFPRNAVGITIAHGDSHWTRQLIHGSRQSIDHVIAVSRGVEKAACQGFPTTVVLNGVDTARLATTRSRNAVRAEFGYGPDDFVVGFVGRFSPEKRPELLLRAVEQLPRRFKVLMVGWGPGYPELLAEANRRIPNRCAFRYSDSYLGDFYQAFDAFTLLSVQEGFALVFLEAMFWKLPVVATPVGAVPEVIQHGVNGLIVQGAPAPVAAELASLEADSIRRARIGAAAEHYAREHGHALRMAEECECLFERLVAERRSRGCV